MINNEMSNTERITKSAYSKKMPIKVLNGTQTTNSNAPAGIGLSAHRTSASPAPKTRVAKFSNIALVLDDLLTGSIAAYGATVGGAVEGIYVEYFDGSDLKHVVSADEEFESWSTEVPENYLALLPYFFNALLDDPEPSAEEFRDIFIEAKNEYLKNGHCDVKTVAALCDSFYYGVLPSILPDKEIEEECLKEENIKQMVKENPLQPLAALDGINMHALRWGSSSPASEDDSDDTVVADDWDAAKNGEYAIQYEWEDTSKIPSLKTLDEFVPSDQFYSMMRKIYNRANKVLLRLDSGADNITAIGKDYVNCFITGRPGTGKTTLAYALGAALQLPVYTVPCTKNTEEDTFQGMTKVVDGKLQFVSTDFLNAYENGGIVVLEEINLADPAVIMGALGQAVEFPFVLQKNGFETVRRHPLFFVIGTMNVGTYGSKGVNQALSSRFKQTYLLDDPDKASFIKILCQSGGATKPLATWIYEAYTAILSALRGREYNAEDLCTNLTLRGCLGAIECIEEGTNPKQAIKDTLIGKIAEQDLEIANKVYEDVVANLREFRG